MPVPVPADPFKGTCQCCEKTISRGKRYYTVTINRKETHIC